MSDENSWDFDELATQECDMCGKLMIECTCKNERVKEPKEPKEPPHE